MQIIALAILHSIQRFHLQLAENFWKKNLVETGEMPRKFWPKIFGKKKPVETGKMAEKIFGPRLKPAKCPAGRNRQKWRKKILGHG